MSYLKDICLNHKFHVFLQSPQRSSSGTSSASSTCSGAGHARAAVSLQADGCYSGRSRSWVSSRPRRWSCSNRHVQWWFISSGSGSSSGRSSACLPATCPLVLRPASTDGANRTVRLGNQAVSAVRSEPERPDPLRGIQRGSPPVQEQHQ